MKNALPGASATQKEVRDRLRACGFAERFNALSDRDDLPGVLDADVLLALRGPKTRLQLVDGDLELANLVLAKGSPCLIVTGSLRAGRVTQADGAGSLLVAGDLIVDALHTEGEIVVGGKLVATKEIVASASNRQLHVFGAVEARLAVAERGHLLHFLGGGSIDELRDEEGGRELVRELGKVAKKISVRRFAA